MAEVCTTDNVTRIEKMFVKPKVSNQIARDLSQSLTHRVKETVTKTLLPVQQAQTSAMYQDSSRGI